MDEISIYDDAIYRLLEELYRLNHRKWQKRILKLVSKKKHVTYKQIKETLDEVPDLLAYRCLKELLQYDLIKRSEEEKVKRYTINEESGCLKIIMKELSRL